MNRWMVCVGVEMLVDIDEAGRFDTVCRENVLLLGCAHFLHPFPNLFVVVV
jgi:hypothetical protein